MNLPDIFIQALGCSAICLTMFVASREGMVLHWLNMLIECLASFLPKPLNILYKPFLGCLTCMCSVWGTVFYLTIFPYSGIREFILLIAITAMYNFILDLLIALIESIILINKNESFQWTDRVD